MLYVVTQATNFPDSSEYLANLSDQLIRCLPAETGMKMRTALLRLCQKEFMGPYLDPYSEVFKKPGQTRSYVSIYTGLKPQIICKPVQSFVII